MLNNDILMIIYQKLHIVPKRNFVRINRRFNELFKHIKEEERIFFEKHLRIYTTKSETELNLDNEVHDFDDFDDFDQIELRTLELLDEGSTQSIQSLSSKHLYKENRILYSSPQIYSSLSQTLNKNVLRFLLNINVFNEEITAGVAATGNIKILEWVVDHGGIINWKTAAFAARNNHLDVIYWLIDHKYQIDDKMTCAYAALGGHKCLIDILRKKWFRFCIKTFYYAALGGHQSVLEMYLKTNKKIDYKVFYYAANNGNISVLEYLYDKLKHNRNIYMNRDIWIKKIYHDSVRRGHYDIINWINKI